MQIGARRCFDPTEDQCLMPVLGSGPYANTSGTGFYSVDHYKVILKYAKERYVEVIPEFDMPGHSYAAIRALHRQNNQPRRRNTDSEKLSVLDELDTTVYKSGQNFEKNAFNPCVSSTYSFVRKIMQAVKEMHRDIQPLAFYHFGGDEVAHGAWAESRACDELNKIQPGN